MPRRRSVPPRGDPSRRTVGRRFYLWHEHAPGKAGQTPGNRLGRDPDTPDNMVGGAPSIPSIPKGSQ